MAPGDRRGRRHESHFWQEGGGHDRNVTEPRTLTSAIEYVHVNPVRAGFVERGAEWTYSSAGWFVDAPLHDLRPDPIPPEWTHEE